MTLMEEIGMARRGTLGLVLVDGDSEGRTGCPGCWRGQVGTGPRPFVFDVFNSDPAAEQWIELRGAPGAYEFRRATAGRMHDMTHWTSLDAEHVRCRGGCHSVFRLADGRAVDPEDV